MAARLPTTLAAVTVLVSAALVAAQATRPADGGHPGRVRGREGVLPSGTALVVARDVVGQMELPADERAKVDAILKQARADARAIRLPTADEAATPTGRRAGAAARQQAADIDEVARLHVEAELTAEQVPTYARKTAELNVANGRKRVGFLKTAAAKIDLSDDERSLVNAAFDAYDTAVGDLAGELTAAADLDDAAVVYRKASTAGQAAENELYRVFGDERFRALNSAANDLLLASLQATSRPTR